MDMDKLEKPISTHQSIHNAVRAYFLARNINWGIMNLSTGSRSEAEHYFKESREFVLALSSNIIPPKYAEKWIENLDNIIRVITTNEQRALHLARDLQSDIDGKFVQLFSSSRTD